EVAGLTKRPRWWQPRACRNGGTPAFPTRGERRPFGKGAHADDRGGEPEGRDGQDDHDRLPRGGTGRAGEEGPTRRLRPAVLDDHLARRPAGRPRRVRPVLRPRRDPPGGPRP